MPSGDLVEPGERVVIVRRIWAFGPVVAAAVLLHCLAGFASTHREVLDSGFHSMYDLDFADAQQRFTAYQHDNPNDPMGSVAEAAGLLFSEFDRLGATRGKPLTMPSDCSRFVPTATTPTSRPVSASIGSAVERRPFAGFSAR